MEAVKAVLNWIWDLEILTGHRTKIARAWFVVAGGLGAYQELATSAEMIVDHNVDLPDIPSWIMVVILPTVTAWMAGKVKKFAREHKG